MENMSKGIDLTQLPNDPEKLKQIIAALSGRNESLEAESLSLNVKIENLQEQLNLLKAYRFARRSEKLTEEDKRQMLLFDELEAVLTEESTSLDHVKSEVVKETSNKKGRKPISDHFPRKEVYHELSEQDRHCPCCGKERPLLGYDDSEELVFIPAKIEVLVHKKEKRGSCRCDDFQDGDHKGIISAKAPSRLIPGSIASPGLLSFIITGKFCDSLPFYRHERIFKRIGLEISRTNMCNWVMSAHKKCEPLLELMREKSREGPLINMDETTLQVLKEPGRPVDSKSYMWILIGTSNDNKIILFNYARTRHSDIPVQLLGDYSGALQTDGYDAYNKVVKENKLWHVGCMAHARRKFYDAKKAAKKKGNAQQALKFIEQLYKIETALKSQELNPEDYILKRRQKAISILQQFRKWLVTKKMTVLPSSALGKAISYTLSEYVKLVRYLRYPFLSPDNNLAENSIRPFVVGRKNWLFNDTPRGAYASASMYSLIETAKANGVEPYFYLKYIFKMIPMTSKEDMESLLPWNISKEDLQ